MARSPRRPGALRRALRVAPVLLVALLTVPGSAAGATDPVLVCAGDIASCSSTGDSRTAALIGATPGTVFTLGDNAYASGTAAQYRDCYGPTWGLYRSRTRPAAGNHDYVTTGAAAYFDYFGTRAGNPRYGFYAYDVGTWRVYVLNSNCWAVGGCAAGSPQERWLRRDLAAYPHQCVLAYWHHPLYSSGLHGNNAAVRPLWQALQDAHAELVLNGHDHDYERFAPQNAWGTATSAGIRQIVVGTGGVSRYAWGVVKRNSVVRDNATYGVLKLTLRATSYSWRFLPVAGSTFHSVLWR